MRGILLSVILLRGIILKVILLRVIRLSVILLKVIRLIVYMLSAALLNVVLSIVVWRRFQLGKPFLRLKFLPSSLKYI